MADLTSEIVENVFTFCELGSIVVRSATARVRTTVQWVRESYRGAVSGAVPERIGISGDNDLNFRRQIAELAGRLAAKQQVQEAHMPKCA